MQPECESPISSTIANFEKVRAYSLTLIDDLSAEDLQLQSMPEASPLKWHLAHTSWAFETFLLKPYAKNYQPFCNDYEYLFNSYYNAIGKQFTRSKRSLLSRPDLPTVLNYRAHVDRGVSQLLASCTELDASLSSAIFGRLQLCIHHEQQHQELMITDLKHAFFENPLYPGSTILNEQHTLKAANANAQWIPFEGGTYTIGHPKPSETKHFNSPFYFDNEGPQHQHYLPPFHLSSRLVTCGEYIDFIENGGYQNASFWLSEAWGNIQEQNISSPYYWIKRKGQWFHYTLSGLLPIDPTLPVSHINYFEASAYACSQGKRLPTEQEWEVAANQCKASKTSRLEQMFNSLWQWTASAYSAYPGFKVPEGAIGEYNGKFMVNQYVLRGGSVATPKGHIRSTYRNFFYPDASWQFSGIRLAESLE